MRLCEIWVLAVVLTDEYYTETPKLVTWRAGRYNLFGK